MTETEHLLTKLMEECAEVTQRASKAIIFGLDEVQPGQSLTNAQRLAGELTDLRAVVEMLEQFDGLPPSNDAAAIDAHKEQVLRFMNYAEECGTLTR